MVFHRGETILPKVQNNLLLAQTLSRTTSTLVSLDLSSVLSAGLARALSFTCIFTISTLFSVSSEPVPQNCKVMNYKMMNCVDLSLLIQLSHASQLQLRLVI